MTEERKKQTVLVVDDTPENIEIIMGLLQTDYKVKAALNGEKALKIANATSKPDIILLDIMMPEMDGYEVCRKLKDNPLTAAIPVIFLTAKSEVKDEVKGLELGAVDYVTKPISPPILKLRVKTHLALYDQQQTLEGMVAERTAELNETRLEIIYRLGRAAEYKDNETGLHIIRMSYYAKLIGEAIGLNKNELELLFQASQMHDIGKIGVPDHILTKPGKLEKEEWDVMMRHPEFGAEIIGEHEADILKYAKNIALTHHEKWNGKGYPRGMKGEEIPLMGRITAIADVFDALTSERPYKKSWSVEDAVELIKRESGEYFDPKLVEAFLSVLSEILEKKEMYKEENSH